MAGGLLATIGLPAAALAAPVPVPYFSEPAISPNRTELAFVSGGDIWTSPVAGGEARLLVAHPATESRPLYSPDGRSLAFVSTRTGNGDVYVLALETGELRRITFDDALDQLDSWSADGKWLYFSSTSRDIAGMNDIYRVPATGGTPTAVSADRYANEFFAAPSPDGKTLAFSARGIANNQWWRHGHSHLDESEITLRRVGANGVPTYTALTAGGSKALWPMWGQGGQRLFYVSDQNGQENIWVLGVNGDKSAPKAVTSFTDGRVLWPSISYDGKLIAFERNFKLWTLDTDNGQVREIAVQRRGAPAGPAMERLRFTDRLQELALSPDGTKMAFVVHGEVFAASAADGGEATRISQTPTAESDIAWSPDSRRLVYVSERDGPSHVYSYAFATGQETRLTNSPLNDAAPTFSPDGKQLAFERDAAELRVLDVAQQQEKVLAKGVFGRAPIRARRSFVWSPDGRWVAFTPRGARGFTNVNVVPAASGPARAVSFVANTTTNSVSWSPDGKFLLFDTGQRTEDAQLARIDLLPRTPRFREDQFRDLFKEQPAPSPTTLDKNTAPPVKPATTARPAVLPGGPTDSLGTRAAQNGKSAPAGTAPAKAGKPPVNIVFEDIRRRLSLLPVGVNVGPHSISPDGKWLLLTAYSANQSNLYVYPLDELSKEPAVVRQLTSTVGAKRDAQFSRDSKEIYYLDQGVIKVVPVEAGKGAARSVAVSAEMDVDFEKEKVAVFEQSWSLLRDFFNDPTYNGVNWAAQHDIYAPLIAGARTVDEARRLINLMIGELNASHSGLNPALAAGTVVPAATGRLGLRFDAPEYEQNGRLRVSTVLPLSAAALAGIRPGDVIRAVDGQALTPATNLDELLQYKVGRRVTLRIASAVPASPTATAATGKRKSKTKPVASAPAVAERDVVVRPLSRDTEKGLDYQQWVEERRAYVAKASGGRLGYVHMFDMSAGALSQLHLDLDAENMGREGVVVDVRNNNGGFVNVYAIDVLARRSYLTFANRSQPTFQPIRSYLGQRSLELPTVLVTNQHSLSDAEDFSEGYRAEKLGKIVGEPTGGWIIFTANVSLLDGSSLRLPFVTIRSARDGKVMEMNPRPVDVAVTRPIGESYTGRDVQLDTAVQELLGQLKTQTTGASGGK
ncbi:S41 family peptidase [Hymenobacter sp. BT770]|uniref:S41 family peptidase n=1 Tax=Hymenobacter sp. BT770 TaxID=2886942 RepID=UPI001D11339E|nr:LpqB family beta-propeller domain-containing protein [Hymenobacter sp. BT770]MCC3153160.1 PDZ domain-containing protein [Hymenobacter sp. BT770]MDO3415366.1 S41 family peptidase [Hymenobacter sp. BT770]